LRGDPPDARRAGVPLQWVPGNLTRAPGNKHGGKKGTGKGEQGTGGRVRRVRLPLPLTAVDGIE